MTEAPETPAVGLDGDYWNLGDGPRVRKTVQKEIEIPLPTTPKKPRKKRAPLSEEKKKAIALRTKKTIELKRARSQRRAEEKKQEEEKRLEYLQEKDRVQRDGIEIFDHLFVGGRLSAMNYELLKERNVAGILNVSSEVRMYFSEDEFNYKRISVHDQQDERLIDYFDTAVEFIEQNLKEEKGVHVHCQMGQSRSVTIIVAC